ncbi:Cof-type HAD-IIB family hydrolase [Paenibacillus allorhizosphaerae]|uniref:5-amino-6-(5-phospho-D-ribitylamino)uracil phosphatase YcsE n=1 Tax=Paenibacillus allorhizosphaerae TaxID=2849866 RepID=A0ABN7TL97_9BACL|nr:Cof-type HAD-IIB family hydrolase [Paenibacillus allorhizosphaerae]CAG7635377.1 5-amino-6-(5-phospho-D-ribitylamino)uracil phosphatase YcsE [Paenibacillus allorhizosphaerae]
MKPQYRLLALDLDGTTLTEEKQITEETSTWIKRAENAGVTVVFATGRGTQTTQAYWEQLALQSPMVLVNGAEIWERPNVLKERQTISREHIRRLKALADEWEAHFWGYSVESLTSKRHWTEEMFERDWMKFGIRHYDLPKMERIREIVSGWGELEITRSNIANMEISPKGVTKESGIRKVCEHLGIGMDQVMAVGDNLNDLHLIRAAGLGVAMGNADDELKLEADVMTDTNERAGVAKAIQRYVFGLDVEIPAAAV